jgi:hypothetical protein
VETVLDAILQGCAIVDAPESWWISIPSMSSYPRLCHFTPQSNVYGSGHIPAVVYLQPPYSQVVLSENGRTSTAPRLVVKQDPTIEHEDNALRSDFAHF